MTAMTLAETSVPTHVPGEAYDGDPRQWLDVLPLAGMPRQGTLAQPHRQWSFRMPLWGFVIAEEHDN